MSWDLVVSIVSKAAEFFVEPIGRQIGYVFNYNSNIKKLEDEVAKLALAKERVEVDVQVAKRNGEDVYKDVDKWLTSATGATQGAEMIFKDKADREKNRCFMGLCPNLKLRYQLSRKAKKELEVAIKLQGESKFEKVSHSKPPQSVVHVNGFEAFESRSMVLENIIEALKDVDVNLIGVFGLGGVGKTTIVKKIASLVEKEGIFKSVVMATVTHKPEVKKIQQEIAECLDYKLDVDSDLVRAARLRERLEVEEKILIILDDLWEGIKLEEVGIPCGNDHLGCKILMTSRDQNVFLQMGVQRDFRLDVLENEEAWNLFQREVGEFKDSSLQFIAIEIATRCAGLPILIVTVASALKNKGVPEWSDALEELKIFDGKGIEKQIYKILELSFNFLGDEEKSLFLLCGQIMAHFIPIMGLGLFARRSTVKATRNKLLTLVNNLKRSCMLLEGGSDRIVKMHDVIQHFATSIAFKNHHVFSVSPFTELEEWPGKDVLEHCSAISFPACKKIPKFPEVLECANLLSFLFYNRDSSHRIPDSFFDITKKLKLLDLRGVHLSPLPLSLRFLENLQTLCLDHCFLEDIAVVGDLTKLQVLSLINSTIVQLPKQLGNLTCLKILDLRRCEKLEVIPAGVLSCLTQLEELYMGNNFFQWEGERSNDSKNNVNLSELKLLPNLVTLEMQVTDAKVLPKQLFSEKLEMFKIFIGEDWDWSDKYETSSSRTLKLQLSTSIQLQRVKALLMRTEDLYLDDMKGVNSILYDLEDRGFPQLRHLNVRNSSAIQYNIVKYI